MFINKTLQFNGFLQRKRQSCLIKPYFHLILYMKGKRRQFKVHYYMTNSTRQFLSLSVYMLLCLTSSFFFSFSDSISFFYSFVCFLHVRCIPQILANFIIEKNMIIQDLSSCTVNLHLYILYVHLLREVIKKLFSPLFSQR